MRIWIVWCRPTDRRGRDATNMYACTYSCMSHRQHIITHRLYIDARNPTTHPSHVSASHSIACDSARYSNSQDPSCPRVSTRHTCIHPSIHPHTRMLHALFTCCRCVVSSGMIASSCRLAHPLLPNASALRGMEPTKGAVIPRKRARWWVVVRTQARKEGYRWGDV